MDYTEDQTSIGAWIDDTFPGGVAHSPRKAIRALEEMVELCVMAGASNAEIMTAIRKALDENKQADPSKVAEEAADVVIVLYGLAHLDSFDLHAHIDAKMQKNRKRKWKPNGDGTGYHIKE